jgi:hypothetical protein
MTKTPNTTALETTFVTDEQTAKLVSKVEFALEQLDQVSGGDCSCVNCCSHSAKGISAKVARFNTVSLHAVSLPSLAFRSR